MKLSVKSHLKIDEVFLKNLWNERINVELDKDIIINDGWYEVNFPYTGNKNEITDISINDESIAHLLHTGYYVDGNGDWHQPASAMWDEGGVFKIWIHTKIGIMFERFMNEIANGKFGSRLFDDYMLTVDKPVTLKKQWPESIRTFFGHGDGPHWWNKNKDTVPYKVINNVKINKDDVLRETQRICVHADKIFNGKVTINSVRKSCQPELPFYQLDSEACPNLKKLVDTIGFTNILTIDTQILEPNSFLRMHKDDIYEEDVLPYIRNCKKFYWTLTDHTECYFKIGKSGLLPLDKPTLINNVEHVHSVVSERNDYRTILSIYGELPDDK